MSAWRIENAANGVPWVHYAAGGNRPATEADVWAWKRIDELEAALHDCIPFLAVQMDRYRRDGAMTELNPTHAEIIDRVSALVGGEKLSEKLKA